MQARLPRLNPPGNRLKLKSTRLPLQARSPAEQSEAAWGTSGQVADGHGRPSPPHLAFPPFRLPHYYDCQTTGRD